MCKQLLLLAYRASFTAAFCYSVMCAFDPGFAMNWLDMNKIDFIFKVIVAMWCPFQLLNIYSLYKLYTFCQHQHLYTQNIKMICLVFLYFIIDWVFIGIIEVLAIQNSYVASYATLLLHPFAIIGAWSFCIFGNECAFIQRSCAQNEKIFGLPYLLFVFKFFSLGLGGVFCTLLSYSIFVGSWIWIIIGIFCAVLTIMNVSFYLTCNVLSIYVSAGRTAELYGIPLDDDNEDMMNNLQVNIHHRSLQYILQYGRSKYQNHKYWISRIVIIVSCSLTTTGAIVHISQTNKSSTQYLSAIVIACIAAFIAFLVLLSIVMEHVRNKYVKAEWIAIIIPYDNKFRLICLGKIILLLIKQILIMTLSQPVWSTVFAILSTISWITLAYITYAIDGTFISNLTELKLTHPKRFYHKYLICYTTTNIAILVMLMTSLLSASHNSIKFQYQYCNSVCAVSIAAILFPFIWLTVAKLYNNEFARFKKDIITHKNGNRQKINSVPITLRSVEHFQQNLVIGCLISASMLGFILATNEYSPVYTPICVFQVFLPLIIVISMTCY
eukprot:459143_1